ncbi:MAG: capsular biosynthesis protein [Desulfovibrio sp.]|nr:capsular biosynthesis protein [Desulfovibrio sp.]
MKRTVLFLQGPLSFFFYRFGKALEDAGHRVLRVQLCGGDVAFWPDRSARLWRGPSWQWPQWIGQLMAEEGVTDLVLLGDWRPLHQEAVLLAKSRGVRVWVYEEGYVRPGYVTLEEGGVNASSALPKTPDAIHSRARELRDALLFSASKAPNPMVRRVQWTIWHHVGNFFLWPLFFRYKTHRPYCIGRELTGLIPRYLWRTERRRESISVLRDVVKRLDPFYFMPLQLDSDSQIRRHSPFTGVLDSLSVVITNFAANAPKNSYLLIKNHPLDNGLINYRRYIRSMGVAAGCASRLRFVEDVKNGPVLDMCQAVVLCNSTLGLSALSHGRAVYCLGSSIYAMEGLAVQSEEMPLAEFWCNPRPPSATVLHDFLTVLRHDALVPGNFYSPEGIREVIGGSFVRMGIEGGPVLPSASRCLSGGPEQ